MRNLCDRLLGLCLQWDRFGAAIKADTEAGVVFF